MVAGLIAVVLIAVVGSLIADVADRPRDIDRSVTVQAPMATNIGSVQDTPVAPRDRAERRFARDVDRACARASRRAGVASHQVIGDAVARAHERRVRFLRQLRDALARVRLPASPSRAVRFGFAGYREALRDELQLERRILGAHSEADEASVTNGEEQNVINKKRRSGLSYVLGFATCLRRSAAS